MKLSDVIKVWDAIHMNDYGAMTFADLDRAIDAVVGVENNCLAAGVASQPARLLSKSTALPLTPERWRDVLDTGLEHASHSWHALQKAGLAHVKDLDRQTWPPQCTDAPGSAPYHLAALISYVFEVYCGIAEVYPEDNDEDRPR